PSVAIQRIDVTSPGKLSLRYLQCLRGLICVVRVIENKLVVGIIRAPGLQQGLRFELRKGLTGFFFLSRELQSLRKVEEIFGMRRRVISLPQQFDRLGITLLLD